MQEKATELTSRSSSRFLLLCLCRLFLWPALKYTQRVAFIWEVSGKILGKIAEMTFSSYRLDYYIFCQYSLLL